MLAPVKNLSKFTLLRLLGAILLLSLFFGPTEVFSQEKNALVIAKARIKFYSEEFNKAIEMLSELLQETELTSAQKKESYEILAASYLATENSVEAKNFIMKIIEHNQDYKPIPNLYRSKDYIKLVQKVRKEMKLDSEWDWQETLEKSEPKKEILIRGKRKKWPWIIVGAGLVGVGVTAVISLSSGGEKSDTGFPSPPERPGKN